MADFRALVESINPVDDASRTLLASLLALSPAFADVYKGAGRLTAQMSAAAASFFAGYDAQKAGVDLLADSTSGIDKFLGSTVEGISDAQKRQAQESLDAARAAADLWRAAKDSIEASLKEVRGIREEFLSPRQNRSSSKVAFDSAVAAALRGDAKAAGEVGELAKKFLADSSVSSVDRNTYLRDRAAAERGLLSVLDKTKAQVTLQEAIVAAGEATVARLDIVNQTLTGFAAQVYEFLNKGYTGADRGTAEDAVEKLAKATTDFQYWFSTTQEGDVTTGGQWGAASFTRLAGDSGAFTDSAGAVSYVRATDTILEAAKRSPELRAIWEKQYNIKLPAFAIPAATIVAL